MGSFESSGTVLLQFSDIEAVLFDAGDTLLAYRRPLRILLQDYLMQQQVIVSRQRIVQALEAINPRYERLRRTCRTLEDEQRMWLEVSQDLLNLLVPNHHREMVTPLVQWFMESWRLHKVFGDVRSTLRILKERGYRLGVVSNWEPSLPILLERLGLGEFFEVVVSSTGEGVWKPDPRLFRVAVRRLGITPEKAVNVGDDPHRDVEPAEAAGLKAILLDRFNSYPDTGTPRINSLKELLLLFPGRRAYRVY